MPLSSCTVTRVGNGYFDEKDKPGAQQGLCCYRVRHGHGELLKAVWPLCSRISQLRAQLWFVPPSWKRNVLGKVQMG